MEEILKQLYPKNYNLIINKVRLLISQYKSSNIKTAFSEKDTMVITYGDSIYQENKAPLKTLHEFLAKYINKEINSVHILPFYPYTSDDGFSVTNYLKVNKTLGTWDDISFLGKDYNLMFDAVINHISESSDWFTNYRNGNKDYQNFFIECDPKKDYSKVVRPRPHPLYYKYDVNGTYKYLWATFSKDQLDLNYKNSEVLLKVLEVLLQYSKYGAKYIRLDAIGYLWKELGTSCIHLTQTHLVVKLIRYVLDECQLNMKIITETNVPHIENISYFGNGDDEAHLIYQFPLPPLTLFSYIKEDAKKLLTWVDSLKNTNLSKENTYFNFLASHDGIGLRPVEGILTKDEIQLMVDKTINSSGKIGYKSNPDNTKSPYELNINYLDAICDENMTISQKTTRFISSQVILLSLVGIPGIYIHSLLGSRNDIEGVKQSSINRRINREKLEYTKLQKDLLDKKSLRYKVLNEYKLLLKIRKDNEEFSPLSIQEVVNYDNRIFSIIRRKPNSNSFILVLVNVSSSVVDMDIPYKGINLINNKIISNSFKMSPNEYMWIKVVK